MIPHIITLLVLFGRSVTAHGPFYLDYSGIFQYLGHRVPTLLKKRQAAPVGPRAIFERSEKLQYTVLQRFFFWKIHR